MIFPFKFKLSYKYEFEDFVKLLLFQSLEVHETIAECMIFANHWVAKKIYEYYPLCALVSLIHSMSTWNLPKYLEF